MLNDCFSAELTRKVAGTSLKSQGTLQMGTGGAGQPSQVRPSRSRRSPTVSPRALALISSRLVTVCGQASGLGLLRALRSFVRRWRLSRKRFIEMSQRQRPSRILTCVSGSCPGPERRGKGGELACARDILMALSEAVLRSGQVQRRRHLTIAGGV